MLEVGGNFAINNMTEITTMMKGKSLVELAQAVQDQASRKVDVIADSRSIHFDVNRETKATALTITQHDAEPLVAVATPHTFNQITEHVGVPAKYAQRMLDEAPCLLEQNINHWFENKPATRMVRALGVGGGLKARAFLSNRYQRIENDQLLATVLPELMDTNNGMQVLVTELTEQKMYLKVVFPRMEGEVKKGDLVQYGFTLSNSEIGSGAIAATPFVYRLVCLNGLTLPADVDDTRLRKAHLGRALEIGADYFTDETLRADDKAIVLKLRDTLRAFQDPARWEAVLGKLRSTAGSEQAGDPVAAVEKIAATFSLQNGEKNAVLESFIKGGDYSKWGALNAVTSVANEAGDFDRAQELEKIGGNIITLPAHDWRVIAETKTKLAV